MRRDDDYLRELLLEFESQPDWLILVSQAIGMSPEDRKREYHVLLLEDAGLVVSVRNGTFRMTNAGHDYLSAIRDNGIWAKTKAAVAETGGSAALEIMKAVAVGYVKKQISEKTGVQI